MFGRSGTKRPTEAELRREIVLISQEKVERVFAEALDREDCVHVLYSLVIPDFDDAALVDGYPAANGHVASYILSQSEAFDKSHDPRCGPGMWWLNYRWAVDSRLADWEVSLAGVRIVMRQRVMTGDGDGRRFA